MGKLMNEGCVMLHGPELCRDWQSLGKGDSEPQAPGRAFLFGKTTQKFR